MLVAILDRATKIAVRDSLSLMSAFPSFPAWSGIVHTENPGAAFGFLGEGNPILRSFVLIGVSAAVLIFVVSALWKNHPSFTTPLIRLGLALFWAGSRKSLRPRIARYRH